MTVRHRIVANTYKDSVALMAISSKILAIDGIESASVVMATPTNLDNLVEAVLSAGSGRPSPPTSSSRSAAPTTRATLRWRSPTTSSPNSRWTPAEPSPSCRCRARRWPSPPTPP